MSTPRAIADLDLTQPPGRVYFQTERERAADGTAFVRVPLAPHQFVVLA
jgi:hypothetical protein